MIIDPIPFASQEEMLDAVLEALPPSPETIKLASSGEKRECELLFRAIEEIRQGHSFAFDGFDVNSDIFYEVGNQGERAFEKGSLGLPHPVFAGLTSLTLYGEPAPTIVMAEEVPQTEYGLPTDGPVLCVHAVMPMRWPARGEVKFVQFVRISQALYVTTDDEGFAVFEPVEPPIDERHGGMTDIPLSTLFVMLTVLADDRSTISRTVAPVKVNDARARRGLPLIPPMWTVSRGDLVESKQPSS